MKTMIYEGYAARIAYSEEDCCFVGHLAGIRDVVAFHATTVRELRAAFREAVDDHVRACDRAGIAANSRFTTHVSRPRSTNQDSVLTFGRIVHTLRTYIARCS